MRYPVVLTVVLAFAAMSSLQADLPGHTLTNGGDSTVQKDVLSDLLVAEKALAGACKKSQVVDTKIIKAPGTLGKEKGTGLAWMQWTERWTIDRCGKKVFYTIYFDMRGSAGTMFKIEAPRKT
jgi:hypothetical protein